MAGKFNWTAVPLPYADPAFKSTPVAGTDLAIFARASQEGRKLLEVHQVVDRAQADRQVGHRHQLHR